MTLWGLFIKSLIRVTRELKGLAYFLKDYWRDTNNQSEAMSEDTMFILKSSNHGDRCPKYLIDWGVLELCDDSGRLVRLSTAINEEKCTVALCRSQSSVSGVLVHSRAWEAGGCL